MALRLVRKSSNEPSVSNTDDARMVRYAYGGYDGSVKDFGSCLAVTTNGSTFTIGSGCIVLQGWETMIDANGWSITVTNLSTLRYYLIYLEINLATETSEIKSVYDTAGYPSVSSGDDLTKATTGTARLALYKFTAQNGIIQNVSKMFSENSYVKDIISHLYVNINNLATRLTELGFKKGSLELAYRADPANVLNASRNEVVKIGTNVYLNLRTILTVRKVGNGYIGFNEGETLATIPEGYRPYKDVSCFAQISNLVAGAGTYMGCGEFTIKTTGEIVFDNSLGTGTTVLTSFLLNAGYCTVDPAQYE